MFQNIYTDIFQLYSYLNYTINYNCQF